MKKYKITITSKASHGRYGKTKLTTWVLEEKNKEYACSFALEILAGMTWNEFEEDVEAAGNNVYKFWHSLQEVKVDETHYKYVPYDVNKIIGYEEAEKKFTIKAEVFKG